MAFSSFCIYKIVEKKWKYYYQWQDLLCDTYFPLLLLLPPPRIVNKHVKPLLINSKNYWKFFPYLTVLLKLTAWAEFKRDINNCYFFFVFIYQNSCVYLCTHACTILYACLLLEHCCGLFHTVSEGEWKLKLHCNSNLEEEWIPVPEANFEEMKSCFAKQVAVYTEAYNALHRTTHSHNLNWTFQIFLVLLKLWLLE